LAVKQYIDEDEESFLEYISKAKEDLLATRPTAVNLSWSINKMEKQLEKGLKNNSDKRNILKNLLKIADNIAKEDIKTNKKIGQFGNELIDVGDIILTHCNAGALATVDYGTALGVIRAAYNSGKKINVYMDETRPRLKGASLTAFEMKEENIPATLIIDSAAATLIRDKVIDKIVVGADRIAQNGDIANKIGTFMLSILAKRYDVPFYIAAPISTIDFSIDSGDQIEIEIREDKEITEVRSVRVAPEGIDVYNPAFDITPAENISAIVTEKGIIKPPFIDNIKELKSK
jgi:methylthioribose-1-phosphate isomerase